ncbi:MAG: hypothetical protein V4650_07705 [Pseudomonadota bacterium]
MIVEYALFASQILLLSVMLRFSMVGAKNGLQRLGNPLMWFGLFYTLWFLIPQIFALLPGHLIIGLEGLSESERGEAVMPTQLYLIVFLLSVAVGFATVTLAGGWRTLDGKDSMPFESINWGYAGVLLLVGLFGFHMMGEVYSSLGPTAHRSAIVKSTSGKIYASLSFFGSFATAYLVAHLWLRKMRMAAFLVLATYLYFAFFTDARGRMMWPAVQATMFIWLQQKQVKLGKVIAYAIGGLIVLALLDPLFISFKNNNSERIEQALSPAAILTSLFFTRNFDGFANLALITHLDRIPESLTILLKGGREAYMNTYFPEILAMGVAFPTTFPGEAWIAGKLPFLFAFSMLYGVLLGLLNAFIRRARRESQVWVYLMGIPYLAGIGNDFIPSLGKLIAATAAPVVWMFSSWVWDSMRGSQRKPRAITSELEVRPASTSRAR